MGHRSLGLGVSLRAILRLCANFIENCELDSLTGQALHSLLHRIELGDIRIGHDANPLGTYIGEVHSDFFGGPRTEADAGRSHLEGIFFLARAIHRCGQVPFHLIEQ